MRFFSPDALRAIDRSALDALFQREECVVAAAEGETRGLAVVALLRADYVALAKNSVIHLDSPAAQVAAGRRGARLRDGGIPAAEAHALALCDEVFEGEAQVWFDRWLGTRDAAALDAAAVLIGGSGGDAKEREVFASLFASGVAQRGLRAFLDRKG